MLRFLTDISTITPPALFNSPFRYTPHPLSRIAAKELTGRINSEEALRSIFQEGKMLGVLIVKNNEGEIGYLAAFSGNAGGLNRLEGFVPPICDLLDPAGEFKRGENYITELNRRIDRLENSPRHARLMAIVTEKENVAKDAIEAFRRQVAESKLRRDALRREGRADEINVNESRFMKAELKRLRDRHKAIINEARAALSAYERDILSLKRERHERSDSLQRRLFELYIVKNANGEQTDVLTIFNRFAGKLPPAGAGECCAPKLLQEAFKNRLTPLCMAEFWYGASPKSEVRRHGDFYPACRSKCLPILSFMLQGLPVENDSPTTNNDFNIEVLYRDNDIIVVNKPAGMLTVPGKEPVLSLTDHVKAMLEAPLEPLPVHRLDMATSGIVVFALNAASQRRLQHQFASRLVKKEYVAILDGLLRDNEGTISLPLRPDIDDRPRQMVDYTYGKEAITRYKVVSRDVDAATTRVRFFPETGRTHQLRVHAAHHDGLDCPIAGDTLYGNADRRLFLHAAKITLIHPANGDTLTFSSPVPF